MTTLKAFKHKYCLNLGIFHKHVVQFTDPIPAIYWHAKRAKLTFLNIPVQSNRNNVCVSGRY